MQRIDVGGPWFEDFKVGQTFDDAPALTLTPGHAAVHQALFGDRLRLPLDATLSEAVTYVKAPLAHPNLVCNVAIGQSTWASQRVRGNLFYRRLILQRPVFLGDTLRTTTEVVALRQSRAKPGKPATGMVVLRVRTEDQHGQLVLDFWRCPLIPLRDPEGQTGHADSFDDIPSELDIEELAVTVPATWRLDVFGARTPGPHAVDLSAGVTFAVEARDTVTAAPELVRMTLNLAAAHTDAAASPFGRRLVYGGHTISMASAQIVRALPSLVTIVAWRSCDHTGPVFEGDELRTEVTVEALHPLPAAGALVDLRALTFARRAEGEEQVLDWRLVGVSA